MLDIRRADERGKADFGWLQSRHTFSFGSYHDPAQQGFSDLLVINDDRVAPGMGFDTHGHRDMEIFSYVLEGALEHQDSMGTRSVIRPGEVQMMSAGTGVMHSEYNPSRADPVHFLQIWIVPDRRSVTPRYRDRVFSEVEKRGRLCCIVSSDEREGSLPVYQDTRVYAGCFDSADSASLVLPENRFAYVHVARGSVMVNDVRLTEGDGARIRQEREIRFSQGSGAEVLVFDLRPNELPG